MLLDEQADNEVWSGVENGWEVSRQARELRPDVVVMDLSMPGPPSGQVIRRVLLGCPTTRVLILTMHDDAAYLTSAIAAGAAGYVVKKVADSELLLAIHAVHAGRTFVDFTLNGGFLPPPGGEQGGTDHQRPKDLSPREREVLRLLAEGHSNQQVADQLRVSVKTVETYRTRLQQKLGLKGRADLYRYAAESGILGSDPVEPPE